MSEKLNIYAKIQAVADDIKGVEKDMTVAVNANNSYRAVSDKSVILKVKEAEKSHGIISIVRGVELIKSEILLGAPDQYGKVKTTFVDIIKMTVDIVDIDAPDDKVTVESFGRGVDTGDKGFGKAMTYARKYALLNVYKIATGVDPDAEPNKPIEQVATADIVKLQVINYLLQNDDYREKAFGFFNHANIDDFTTDELEKMHNSLETKKLL